MDHPPYLVLYGLKWAIWAGMDFATVKALLGVLIIWSHAMKLILTGGAVIGAVSAIAYAQSDVIADAFVSGDWAKIAGGLMLLIFAGAAWVVKTQRADIHRLRARLDAQIERDFERETRTLETIHKITSALNALNRSHTQLAKSVNEIEQQLNAGDSKAR